MPSKCNSLGCYKAHSNSKWKIFKKNSLHILHLNINSLLPKIDEIRFIAKQSNASIIGISESKLDSSILNSELDTHEYNLVRLDHSRRVGGRGGGLHVVLEGHYLITISQVFVVTLKVFLQTFSYPSPNQFW